LMCLNQFHDIVPGSSIGEVYEESQRQYAEIRRLACTARDAALSAIGRATGGALVLVNPTPFARRDLAFFSGPLPAAALGRAGAAVRVQPASDGVWLDAGELPPYSATVLDAAPAGAASSNSTVSAASDCLE